MSYSLNVELTVIFILKYGGYWLGLYLHLSDIEICKFLLNICVQL